MARKTDSLGHVITGDGIKMNPNKVEAIQKISLPKNQKDEIVSGYHLIL